LATSTDWGLTARRYRELMSHWKAAGPAPKPVDDALWRRFRAAQDTFFTARSSDLSKRDSEQQINLQAKRALLAEAEALLPVTDWKAARETLRSIHERWEAAGHVPREAMRSIEGRLRRVEEAVRDAEQKAWRRTNPEARARAELTVAQLRASIAELESQLAAHATDPDQAKQAEEALTARRSWLEQAERALDEFGG
jgi:DNA repair exonuclease SbcCD ATPase subunit